MTTSLFHSFGQNHPVSWFQLLKVFFSLKIPTWMSLLRFKPLYVATYWNIHLNVSLACQTHQKLNLSHLLLISVKGILRNPILFLSLGSHDQLISNFCQFCISFFYSIYCLYCSSSLDLCHLPSETPPTAFRLVFLP